MRLIRFTLIATLACTTPAIAQSALETVAYLTLNHVRGQRKEVTIQTDGPKRLTVTDSRFNPPTHYVVTQDSECFFTIRGAKTNNAFDAYDMTFDFSGFRLDDLRTKVISDPLNPNGGRTTQIHLTGARLCRGVHGHALFNAGLKPGECTDDPPLDALWPDMLTRKLKAIRHLQSKFCHGSAF